MARLASWLLNVIYVAVLVVCAPWIVRAAWRTGKYRDGYREKFFGLVPRREGHGPCVWLHAVSVGEVNLLATLIGELARMHPDWQIVVSTTSKTGYELARKKYADLDVFYCPLDFSWAVRRAMRRVRPSLVVLAELELWPNLILAAGEFGAAVAIVNGRISDKSFPSYRRVRWLTRRLLERVKIIAVQDGAMAERFCGLGARAERVCVTGSLKYDGAQTDRENSRTMMLRELAGIEEDDIVFLAGSTQEPEEAISVEIYRKLVVEHPRLRLVVVPRHPERFEEVATLLDRSGVAWQRRSELGNCKLQIANCKLQIPRVLLVDSVGELGTWWGAAAIAFVGGSFGSRGGQNMIEPAAYGSAVSFGPNTWNFRDIVAALLAAEGGVVVKDAAELEAFVRRCLEEPAWAAALGGRARVLVESQLGATRRTVGLLEVLMELSTERSVEERSAA